MTTNIFFYLIERQKLWDRECKVKSCFNKYINKVIFSNKKIYLLIKIINLFLYRQPSERIELYK